MSDAQAILDSPLFNEIFDELEQEAFETCANAKPLDDETRKTSMLEVNAIRSLREKLELLANPVKPSARGSVA